MKRYRSPDDRYQGTGGELARHLLDLLGLQKVLVETTEAGDHYDPKGKAVRLTAGNFEGRSLTAITVAAHEVGHAIQDAAAYMPLRIRTRLVSATRHLERLGAAVLMISPFIGLLTRAPTVAALTFLGGFLALGTAAIVHLVTLPVELDASFSRALPLLEKGRLFEARRSAARAQDTQGRRNDLCRRVIDESAERRTLVGTVTALDANNMNER